MTIIMQSTITLPHWIDSLIFGELGAKYCRSNSDMTVIDWDKAKIQNYLGTYFPRSYTEAYCIASDFLANNPTLLQQNYLEIIDFGCGTGGEIIGLIQALAEQRQGLRSISVKGLDGNQHALRLLESIITELSKRVELDIRFCPSAVKIDDFYDLSILDSILDRKYDIVMSFKAVCEFVTKQQFEDKNAYEHLSRFFKNKLAEDGLLFLVDVTTYSKVSESWLPEMMDKGLAASDFKVINRNAGHNYSFYVSHSRQSNDLSKVAWRISKTK